MFNYSQKKPRRASGLLQNVNFEFVGIMIEGQQRANHFKVKLGVLIVSGWFEPGSCLVPPGSFFLPRVHTPHLCEVRAFNPTPLLGFVCLLSRQGPGCEVQQTCSLLGLFQ